MVGQRALKDTRGFLRVYNPPNLVCHMRVI